MGYVLLALEILMAGWLVFALVGVVSGLVHSGSLRWGIRGVGSLLLLGVLGVIIAALAVQLVGTIYHWLPPALAGLGTLLLIGGVVIWVRGYRVARAWRRDQAQPEMVEPKDLGMWAPRRLLVALAVIGLLMTFTYSGLLNAATQQRMAIQSETETLLASITPPPVAPEDNAADIYLRVGEHFNIIDIPPWWDDATGGPAPYGEDEVSFDYGRRDLADFLAEQQGVRNMLIEAARRPTCQFDRDYTRPTIETNLGEVQILRNIARFLGVDAMHRAATGDTAGALQDIRIMYRLAEHTALDMGLIPALVAYAIDGVAATTLQEVLATGPATEEDLAELFRLNNQSRIAWTANGLRFEEAFVLRNFANLDLSRQLFVSEINGSGMLLNLFHGQLFVVFLMPADLFAFREFWHSSGVSRLPGRTFLEVKDPLSSAVQDLRDDRPGILTMLLTPILDAAVKAGFRAEAEHRVAEVGVAMYRYQLEHGDFPSSIAELSPRYLPLIPADPMDGKPLRMKKTERGVIVYSLGPNCVDDGGVPIAGKYPDGDIIFECVLPTSAADTAAE